MSKTKKEFSSKKLRIIRFGGVLVFIGSFIFALLFTGNDRFLKRCLANGNSVKYCNDIYGERKLAFKEKETGQKKMTNKELKLEEKRRNELKLEEKRRNELKLEEKRRNELKLEEKRRNELKLEEKRRNELKLEEKRRNELKIAASEEDLFLYRQIGASYLCIASKAEVDFNKGLGIASATFANIIIGKHGGAIEELRNEKLDEKKYITPAHFKLLEVHLKYVPKAFQRI